MKRISIQIRIGLLLIFAVILLSATCYLSYRNLSSIVSGVQIRLNPDERLVIIRDISHDLETADNSIRIYTITREALALRSYYSVIHNIDEKVTRLRLKCRNDSIMLNQVDTISSLIEENIVIWNELLYIINNDNVIESLKQLSDQINEAQDNKEKQGILKRVFARNRIYRLNQQELIRDIEKLEEQERITKLNLMTRESQMAAISSRIREKFYDLIARMENRVSGEIMEKGLEANRIAEKTYIWLIMFPVSGGLLLILVLFIIIRYIRDAHTHQVALEKSKIETENMARAKELFMTGISHEIRTPVTAISGFTEQLLHETSDEDLLKSLKIIKSSSDHLAKIIDDILDLSKLQSGKMILENVHFSIGQILEEVSNTFKRQANKNDTRLSYSVAPGTPPVLQGDPYRLKQILMNLAGNSVKFTEHGTVEISVKGITNHNEEVDLLIEVIDTGIGIDSDKLKVIFEDFTQAEMSTARKYGGTGLGLSIVKKLVDLHNGSIECESIKNRGTKITCYLPFRIGREDQLKRDITLPVIIPEEIKNLKILIADDEEYNRLLFKKIFDRWEIKCDEAANGMEAVEILKKRRYDILLMDIRMPVLDGFETTELIRNDMKIGEAEMQIICISATSSNDERAKYRQAGMNAFLRKPFTEEMLLTTILAVKQHNTIINPENYEDEEKNISSGNHKINLDSLYHISGGDDQFVKQMLISFIRTTGNGLKDMLESASSGQWDSTANLAHKMMPPCRHIGATGLYNLLDRIEKNILETTNIQAVEKLVMESVREFEDVSKHLNEYIAKLN